jgi:uncharacterized membrane protein YsdA (DUF1294 family)
VEIPGVFWAYLAAASLAAFVAAGADKRRAHAGARRIPESTLLGLALVGGSPGLMVAMVLFRHKTRKASFLLRFALVLAAQAALLAWWLGRA